MVDLTDAGFVRGLFLSGTGHVAFLSIGILLSRATPSVRVGAHIPPSPFAFVSTGASGPAGSPSQVAIVKPSASVARGLTGRTARPALGRGQEAARSAVAAADRAAVGTGSGPAGPPTLDGDFSGDWYLAAVQAKVWGIWTSGIHGKPSAPAVVEFTILGDGSVEAVRLVESSGDYLFDHAAMRSIEQAKPFSPLPKHYASDRCTIRGVFRPE